MILAFADTHLTPTRPRTGRALERIVAAAQERRPELILFGGDAYDAWPDAAMREQWATALNQLAQVTPVVIAGGNHAWRKGSAMSEAKILLSGSNVHIATTMPELFVVGNYAIVAAPWLRTSHMGAYTNLRGDALRKGWLNGLDTLIQELLSRAPTNSYKLLLAHATVQGVVYSQASGYATVLGYDPVWPPSMLRGFDAAVFGHIHQHQVVPAPIPACYAGSPERMNFGERNEPKGFVTISPGDEAWRLHELPTRPMVQLDMGADEYNAMAWAEGIPEDALVKLVVSNPNAEHLQRVPRNVPWELKAIQVVDRPTREQRMEREEGEDLIGLAPLEALKRYLIAKGIANQRREQLMTVAAEIVRETK